MRPLNPALTVVFSLLLSHVCLATDPRYEVEADQNPMLGKLQLIGGDIYRGEFGKSENPNGTLVWRCPAFDSDLVVPWDSVDNILQSRPKQSQITPALDNQFIVEMQNGEALTGSVASIGDEFVDVDSRLAGKKRIPIAMVRSILRTSPKTESDAGELKMADWKQIAPPIKKGGRGNWFDGHGSYDTETAGTVISQSINVPDLATIDIGVSWQSTTPNWLVQIGEPRKLEIHARKLENRNTLSVTVLVEDETTADITTAQLPLDGSNSLNLQVLCDSVRGRLVLMHNANAIAQLRLNKSLRLTGQQSVHFTNNVNGRLSLRSLKIYRSVFSSPVVHTQGKDLAESGNINSPETLLQNGQTFVGKPIGFDTSNGSFGFESTEETLGRVTLSQVDRIEFPQIVDDAAPSSLQKLYSVQLWNGDRFVGKTISIQANQLSIALEQSQANVHIPLEDVMAVGQSGVPRTELAAKEANEDQLQLRFASPWVVSYGQIVGTEQEHAPKVGKVSFRTLIWKPFKASFPVALAVGASGTIEPIGSKAKLEKARSPLKATADFGRSLDKDEPSLFLKSGDCFAAEVNGVKEGELYFQSSLFVANKIDADLVRGVRKLAYTGTDTMEKVSRKRLLTLPRSQRNNPPTHLVISREGDAIRGQLQYMDIDELTIQVRGEDRKLQMKNIAEIIWLLDAPEIVPPGKAVTQEPEAIQKQVVKGAGTDDLNCQALDLSGTRISIIPERVEEGILYGQHPQLGPCQVDLSKISKLVLGDTIAVDTKLNRFEKWKLENALDPKFVNDLDSVEAEGNASDSPQARLISKPAPSFELSKLDGTIVKLSDLKGQIVVLDFWASWCGPCVASLPKITEIGQEYKGAKVEVIAVNVEETVAVIRSFLERNKLNPLVVLDSDGAIAKAYQATAIPQTVIIDREGVIKHVFVGGGLATEAKIREALDGMLNIKL